MRAMTARLVADRDQNITPPLYAFDLPLQNSQLRWIDLIISRVDRDERRFDTLEIRSGIVIARGIERIQHVVGVRARELSSHLIVEETIGRVPRRRLLVPLQRATGHEQ